MDADLALVLLGQAEILFAILEAFFIETNLFKVLLKKKKI